MAKKTRAQRDRDRLIKYLQGTFGVRVIEHTDAGWFWQARGQTLLTNGRLTTAPFTDGLGVVWSDFEIHAMPSTPWAHLLHEAGHLVASNEPPDSSNEYVFLGWELAVVEHLGLSMRDFHKDNASYGINWQDYIEMDSLVFGSKDWWKFVGEVQATARAARLINKWDAQPFFLRTNVLKTYDSLPA